MNSNENQTGKKMLAVLFVLFLQACGGGESNQTSADIDLTAPISGIVLPSEVTLYAAGDIADCQHQPSIKSGAAKTAALIQKELGQNPNGVVLTLGDNTYPDGKLSEFTDCYHPTWGQFKARTFPSPGNHDYNTAGAIGYYDYFGTLAGPARRGYYSVELGSWLIVSLNSNLSAADSKAQLSWLKSELKARPHFCTLAYWHHPLFSSGKHGNNAYMKEVWEVLQAAGADLILNGHDHDYERFGLQNSLGVADLRHGMREFVVGTGGAELAPMSHRIANSEFGDSDFGATRGYGVLKLILRKNSYTWKFMPVDPKQKIDQGTDSCR